MQRIGAMLIANYENEIYYLTKNKKKKAMGLDLRLLPQYNERADFSHDILSLSRDGEMFNIISEVEKENGKEIPRNGIYTFLATGKDGESKYGKTYESPYGDIINSVQCKNLKEALKDFMPKHWKNKAIKSFINELPDNLEVWIYWH